MACTLNERFDYLKEKFKAIGENVSGSDLAKIKDVLKRSMSIPDDIKKTPTDFNFIIESENEYRAATEIDPYQTDVPQLAHAVKVELSRLKALVANNDDGKYSNDIESILNAMKDKTLAEIDRGESELVYIFDKFKNKTSKITSEKENKSTRILKNISLIAKGKLGYPDGFNMNDDLLVLESKSASDVDKKSAYSRIMKRNILIAQHAVALDIVGYKKSIPSYLSKVIVDAKHKLSKLGMSESMLSEDAVTKNVIDKLEATDHGLRKRLMSRIKKVRDIVKKYFEKKKKIISRIDKSNDNLEKVNELIAKVESGDALTIDDMNVLDNIYSRSDKKTNVKNKYSSNLNSALEHTGITKIMTASGSPLQKLRALMSNPFGINTNDLQQLTSEILNDRSSENFTDNDASNIKKFIDTLINAYTPGKSFTSGTSISNDGRIETSIDNYDIGSLLSTTDNKHLTYEIEESLKYAVPLAMNQIATVKYDILKMAKDPKDIIDNFSFVSDKNDVDTLRTEASNGSVPISSLIKDISQVVSDMIGLKPNENMDIEDRAKFDAGIKALVYAQIVQDNSVIKVKALDFNGSNQYFVNVNESVLDETFTAEEISDMKDSITKLTYLVSEKKKIRPSFNPLPVPETVHNNQDIKLSDIDKDNLEKRNNTPWNFDENFKAIAEMAKYDSDAANKLFGYVDSKKIKEMNIEDQLLQVAKNDVIVRELTELLKEYDKIGLNKDFYLNFVVTSPKRTTIMSNITPMDSKIVHRPFLNKKSYVKDLSKLSNATKTLELKRDQLLVLDGSVTDEESFEVAISEAFGIGVDKMSRYGIFNEIRGIIDIYGTSGVKVFADPIIETVTLQDGTVNTITKDSPYKPLKDFLEDDSEPMDLSLLIPFTEKFGSHAMAAAIELKKLHIAKQNQATFSHSLTIEADAISSGPSLLAQMVGWSEQTRAILSKTGIMNEEDYKKYEKYTRDILAEHYGISDKNKDKIVFNMPSLIEAGKIHAKMKGESFIYKTHVEKLGKPYSLSINSKEKTIDIKDGSVIDKFASGKVVLNDKEISKLSLLLNRATDVVVSSDISHMYNGDAEHPRDKYSFDVISGSATNIGSGNINKDNVVLFIANSPEKYANVEYDKGINKKELNELLDTGATVILDDSKYSIERMLEHDGEFSFDRSKYYIEEISDLGIDSVVTIAGRSSSRSTTAAYAIRKKELSTEYKELQKDKDKYGDVYSDLYTHIGTTAANVIDSLDISKYDDIKKKRPSLFNSLRFLINNSAKLFIENIRDIAKPPVMTNAYGASLGSIKRELSENNIETLFVKSIRGELDEPVKYQFAKDILVASTENAKPEDGQRLLDEHMKDAKNFKFIEEIDDMQPDSAGYYPAKNYMLTNERIKDSLKDISDKTLGSAFETSMTENMGEIEDYRDAMKTLDVVHVEMVKTIMDDFVSKARKENDGKLTKDEFTKIIQKMNEIGYGYTIEMFNSQQAFYKKANATDNRTSGHGYAKISGPNSEMFGSKKGGKITQSAQEKEYVSNMGAYPTTSIHMIDGELMRHALEKNDFTSIYDAILFPSDLNVVDKTTHEYNKYAPELLAKNNALDITYEKMNKIAEFLNNNQELKDAVIYKFNFVESFSADIVKNYDVIKNNKAKTQTMGSKIIGKDNNGNNILENKILPDSKMSNGITIRHRDVNGNKQIKIFDSNMNQTSQVVIKNNDDGTVTVDAEMIATPSGAEKFRGAVWKTSVTMVTESIQKHIDGLNEGQLSSALNLLSILDPNKKGSKTKYTADHDNGFTPIAGINKESGSKIDESSNLYSDLQKNRAKMFTKTNWIETLYQTINTVATNREKLLDQGKLNINHMAVGMTTFTDINMNKIDSYPNVIRTNSDALGSLLNDISNNIDKSIDEKIKKLFNDAGAELETTDLSSDDYKNISTDIHNIYNHVYNIDTEHEFVGAVTSIGRKLLRDIESIGGTYKRTTGVSKNDTTDIASIVSSKKYLDVIDSYLSNKDKC